MTETGVRILIADEHWPRLLAQSCYMAIEALRRAGVTAVPTTHLERVIDEKTEDGLLTGWCIDVIADDSTMSIDEGAARL